MANIAIFRINYKSDFLLTLESDAGWMTPFCIKFWTGAPSQAYFAGYDGTTYTNCSPVEGEPSKLVVQFDDHHLPIGELKFQIGYHFTVDDFPTTVEDEVLNQASVIIVQDGEPAQVMLDLNGETAPEIEFALPAYANEQQRIENEEQRIENEQARVEAEEARVAAENARVDEFAQLKTESEEATANANAAAQLATEKAALAQQKADYAQTQGDYAKAQGDYAKSQGDIAQDDHQRAESDHATATADHTQAASDHSTATADHTQAAADHTQSAADHTRAESDHTRAESDHAAVEVYVDSLGAFDISAYNETGGVLAKYADLTAALGTGGANIPEAIRKGGMSVKFVQSSDNKYVQYRLMADSFSTTVSDWQGVDDEPTAGSDNIVKSGGVKKYVDRTIIDLSSNLLAVANKYIKKDGTEGGASGWNHTSKIYLNKISDLATNGIEIYKGRLSASTTYNIPSAVFFDADGSVLGYYDTAVALGSAIPYASIPSGSVYAMFNSEASELLIANYGQEYIIDSLSKHSSDIGDLGSEIHTVEDALGITSKTVTLNSGNNYTAFDSLKQGSYLMFDSSIGGSADVYLASANNELYERIGSFNGAGKFKSNILPRDAAKLYFWVSGTGGSLEVSVWGNKQDIGVLQENAVDVDNKLFTKVDVNTLNLIDETKITDNKGITASGTIVSDQSMCVSDYVPINSKNIISNGHFNAYWGGAVYDKNKSLLRALSTTQYTYQDGDCYIRLTFLKTNTSKRANYGNTLAAYTTYNPIYNYLGSTRNEISSVSDQIEKTNEIIGVSTIPFTINIGNTVFVTDIIKRGSKIEITVGSHNDAITFYTQDQGGHNVEGSWEILASDDSLILDFNQNAYQLYAYYHGSNPVSATIRPLGLIDEVEEVAKSAYEIADGNFDTYEIGDYSNTYVKSRVIDTPYNNQSSEHQPVNVVAVNHDDLGASDYVGTRKIYNKFGFKANFNFILLPFSDYAKKKAMCSNVRAMIKDGHHLGLHAIMGQSYWMNNKMFDITPTGGHLFAPTLSEMKGSEPDGTGVNSFGQTITSTTTFGALHGFGEHLTFHALPSELSSIKVVEATEADWLDILNCYTRYMDITDVSGLDLNDDVQTWSKLKWLEYWYNELIDASLGYSSDESILSDRFAEDYDTGEGVGSYPDASHLLSGKVVFFDDTTNPNYNNAEYQRVGRFTKGLFKGCASCCNYEVITRSIEIAEAFCRHYFGLVKFTNYGKHGIGFMIECWTDSNGIPYDNREKTIFSGYNSKLYVTSSQKFVSQYDMLLERGIKMTNYNFPESPTLYYAQRGLFDGMKEIRGAYFNQADQISFLCSFTDSQDALYSAMTPSVLKSIIKGHENNLIQWLYENAGGSVVVGGTTYYIKPHLKTSIDNIRSIIGTGRIPHLSLDTISAYPNTLLAVHLLAQYCYYNDISIVPLETARLVACSHRKEGGNLFPNPNFKQSLIEMFGGSSSSYSAYLPDCWKDNDASYTVSVEDEVVDGIKTKKIIFSSSDGAIIGTYIYGLQAGKYQFKAKIKSNSSFENAFVVSYIKCGTNVGNGEVIQSFDATSEYSDISLEIIIPDFTRKMVQDTAVSKFCDGYDENVMAIEWKIRSSTNNSVTLCNPSLKFIE